MKPTTLDEIAGGLAERQFSSVEYLTSLMQHIRDDSLNAFISVNDRALEQAAEADRRRVNGTARDLEGLPVAVKDVFVTADLPTTAGSKMLEGYVPSFTATAVQRLVDRGMIIVGKTNCDEFAMGSSNENSAYGAVKNPHDETRVPGGSSGGSAAAVAAGLAPVALGSDTGSSVRLPAAFCGTVGLKPTYGRISRYGLIAMASSLDHVGVFSTNLADAATLLGAMAGYDEHDATSSRASVDSYRQELDRPIEGVRIGVPREYLDLRSDPKMEKHIDALLKRYRSIPGVSFHDVALPHTKYGVAAYYLICSSEVSANMARYDGLRYGATVRDANSIRDLYEKNRSQGLGPEVKRRIMLGTFALSAGYHDQFYTRAAKARTLVRLDFDDVFKKVDVVLAPVAPTRAFPIGERTEDPLKMYLTDVYAVGANLAGVPALAYPAGMVDGLPVGLQLMGPPWSEASLFRIAKLLMAQAAP